MNLQELLGKATPRPWKYGVRDDGSVWVSLGTPDGRHRQFDWPGDVVDAQLFTHAVNNFEGLREAAKVGLRALNNLNGKIDVEVWNSLYAANRILVEAIRQAEEVEG